MLTFENIFASYTKLAGYIDRLPALSTAMSEAYGRGMMAKGTVEAPAPNSPGALIGFFDNTRRMARGRAIDARPNTVSPRGMKTKWVKPMYFAESMPFHYNEMGNAMALPIDSEDPGAVYMRRNLQSMKEALGQAFEFMWVQTLLGAGFKYSTTGNNDYVLQYSTYSGGDAVTVDTGSLPADHLDQIALGPGGSDIIDAPWDDATANIFGQFLRLNVAIARETGLPIGEIWMNGNTAYHMFQNTSIRNIIGNQVSLIAQFEERAPSAARALQPQSFRLQGLPGIKFMIYDGVFTTADVENLTYEELITSTYAELAIPDNRAIFTPPRETASEWSGFVPVKRTIVETSNLRRRDNVVGFDSYKYETSFPAGFMTENSAGGLPFLTIPRAVFAPTVIFETGA